VKQCKKCHFFLGDEKFISAQKARTKLTRVCVDCRSKKAKLIADRPLNGEKIVKKPYREAWWKRWENETGIPVPMEIRDA